MKLQRHQLMSDSEASLLDDEVSGCKDFFWFFSESSLRSQKPMRKARRVETEELKTQRNEVFLREKFFNMDFVNMDLALRLGFAQFSYMPHLIKRLECCQPTLIINTGLFPLAPDLDHSKSAAIGLNHVAMDLGLGKLQATKFESDGRFWASSLGSIKGVITEDHDYIFIRDGDGEYLRAIDVDGDQMCIDKDILKKYELEPTYEDEPIFYTFCINNENVFLMSQNFVISVRLEELFSGNPEMHTIEIPREDGVLRDAQVEGDVVSCIRYQIINVTNMKKHASWRVSKGIKLHQRFNKLANVITFIAVTNSFIELRDFYKDEFRWDEHTITVPRQKSLNFCPISFVFKDIFILEEDRGSFMAYDILNRRCVRFQSEFFSWLPFTKLWMFQDAQDALYLSLTACSWYLP